MRGIPLALAASGLAVLVVGLLAGRAAWMPDTISEPEPEQQAAAGASAPVPKEPTSPAADKNVRPVAPDVVAIPPVEPKELVRVEPREPLSPFAQPLPPPKPDNSSIPRPVAEAAGRLLGDRLVVSVAGVDIVEPDELCTDPEGFDWPCGMRARTAFRGLLRGRAVSCDVPEGFEGKTITTACTLGKRDLGEWIVANGWGRATPGGPYVDEERAAREAEKGIFGYGPEPLPVMTFPMPDFMNGG
jgi:endonuclease YncB( thermonuclease family)